MKKIVEKLMDYGMDFEYENRGSEGEKICSHELGLEISSQNGRIYFELAAPTQIVKETENNYKIFAQDVENECIAVTSSF